MPQIGQVGAASVYDIGQAPGASMSFSFSTPAGWTMLWWGLSVLVILAMFFML